MQVNKNQKNIFFQNSKNISQTTATGTFCRRTPTRTRPTTSPPTSSQSTPGLRPAPPTPPWGPPTPTTSTPPTPSTRPTLPPLVPPRRHLPPPIRPTLPPLVPPPRHPPPTHPTHPPPAPILLTINNRRHPGTLTPAVIHLHPTNSIQPHPHISTMLLHSQCMDP